MAEHVMADNDEFRFVSLLALELENGDISLPSLPDVVLKIRKLLESDNCTFELISKAVSVDAALVSRLFVFANSAYYNRANIKAETLDAAISRLGFEVVRNTAMSLAMKQLYNTDAHDDVAPYVRDVWSRGVRLACMSYAIARTQGKLNQETAYLCGLMHDVGKRYILTKAGDFPEFLGEPHKLESVMAEWNPQVTKSIVESWGFPEEVVESTDPVTYAHPDTEADASLIDVVIAADMLLELGDEEPDFDVTDHLSCIRLDLDVKTIAEVMDRYKTKLKTVQQSLA